MKTDGFLLIFSVFSPVRIGLWNGPRPSSDLVERRGGLPGKTAAVFFENRLASGSPELKKEYYLGWMKPPVRVVSSTFASVFRVMRLTTIMATAEMTTA